MSIVTLHFSPETERKLRDQANQAGQTLEVYLERLAESTVASGAAQQATLSGAQPKYISDPKSSQADFERLLNELTAGPTLPVLPPDFSRADIYDDHD